jgi:hypothetical protein
LNLGLQISVTPGFQKSRQNSIRVYGRQADHCSSPRTPAAAQGPAAARYGGHIVRVSGSAEDLGEMMAHPGTHGGRLPQSTPPGNSAKSVKMPLFKQTLFCACAPICQFSPRKNTFAVGGLGVRPRSSQSWGLLSITQRTQCSRSIAKACIVRHTRLMQDGIPNIRATPTLSAPGGAGACPPTGVLLASDRRKDVERL